MTLASRFDGPDQSAGLLLWQVTNRWQVEQRAALAPLGLTHVQFVLLAALVWLAAANAPVTQKDVARQAATDPMMTSQVLRALETKQLVRRDPHPHDGRARSLTPTTAGIELANRAIAVVEQCDERFFGAEAAGLAETLVTVRNRQIG